MYEIAKTTELDNDSLCPPPDEPPPEPEPEREPTPPPMIQKHRGGSYQTFQPQQGAGSYSTGVNNSLSNQVRGNSGLRSQNQTSETLFYKLAAARALNLKAQHPLKDNLFQPF